MRTRTIVVILSVLFLCAFIFALLGVTGVLSRFVPGWKFNGLFGNDSGVNFTKVPVTPAVELVPCTFAASDPVVTHEQFNARIFAARLDEKQSYIDTIDMGTRSFSMAALKQITGLTQSLTARFEPKLERFLGMEVEMSYQVCDAENKTNLLTYITASGPTVSASNVYLHSGRTPVAPGKYRADALIRLNGVNYLLDRTEVEILP